MNKLINCIFIVFFVLAAFPTVAHAYIDPGSGIILLQVVFALFAGAVFSFRNWFFGLVKKIFGGSPIGKDG